MATAAGFLVGLSVTLGGVLLGPGESTHWLVWLAVSAAAFEATAKERLPWRPVIGAVRVLAVVAIVWILLSRLGAPWTGWPLVGLCVGLPIFVASLDRATARGGWPGPLTMSCVLVGSVGVLAMGYSAVLALSAASLLAAWAGAGETRHVRTVRTETPAPLAVPARNQVAGILTFGLWLLGLGHAEARLESILLLGAAPLSAFAVAALAGGAQPAWARGLGAAAAAACALAALVLAWLAWEPPAW